ncbi:MAG: hypothetical protein PUJ72_01640 [Eubacteriales bacterium]|nr:hypothetical protein [Eubacteriales bacterium]
MIHIKSSPFNKSSQPFWLPPNLAFDNSQKIEEFSKISKKYEDFSQKSNAKFDVLKKHNPTERRVVL